MGKAKMGDYRAVIPDFYSVIPAKAGIQRVGDAVRALPLPLLTSQMKFVPVP